METYNIPEFEKFTNWVLLGFMNGFLLFGETLEMAGHDSKSCNKWEALKYFEKA